MRMTIVARGPATGGEEPMSMLSGSCQHSFRSVAHHCSHAKSEHLLTGGADDVSAWLRCGTPAAIASMPSARPAATIRRLAALTLVRSFLVDVLIVLLLSEDDYPA